MRIPTIAFAVTLIGIGIVGIANRDLMPVWNPVPGTGLAHTLLLAFGIGASLASGIGLLVHRSATVAARFLLATLFIWLLLFRLPTLFHASLFGACWSIFPLLAMMSAVWVTYVWFANDWDQANARWISNSVGLYAAQALFGLTLIFFGSAHFIDIPDTVSLIPNWLPGHLFWAYLTGCTFVAAGVAVLFRRFAQLAAALSAVQIGLFLLLVWIPIIAGGSKVPFHWSETFLNAALLAAAWVVADSYGSTTRSRK